MRTTNWPAILSKPEIAHRQRYRKRDRRRLSIRRRNTPVAKELEGEWKGDYEMLGYTRHVSIKFANHPDGATADFVIVGRKHNVLPVDLVTQEGDLVTVDSHEMGFTFEGRLRDGKLTGAIRQGAIETPLVLERAK